MNWEQMSELPSASNHVVQADPDPDIGISCRSCRQLKRQLHLLWMKDRCQIDDGRHETWPICAHQLFLHPEYPNPGTSIREKLLVLARRMKSCNKIMGDLFEGYLVDLREIHRGLLAWINRKLDDHASDQFFRHVLDRRLYKLSEDARAICTTTRSIILG